jgi:PTH1 family peptidyl-tRNA hydrolase
MGEQDKKGRNWAFAFFPYSRKIWYNASSQGQEILRLIVPVVLVGLGNPGEKYQFTRHNAGFLFLDAFAQVHGFPSWKTQFQGAVTAKDHGDLGKLILLKPQTFMNCSGQSVVSCLSFFKIPPAHLFVVHDDLDLPVGNWKLKQSGSHRGHNGVRDIHQQLKTDAFMRLMLGIDRPADKTQINDYVVSPFLSDECQTLKELFLQLFEKVPLFLKQIRQNF